MNASDERSSDMPGGPIIRRMAAYAREHPEATEYAIADEAEAEALLEAIADQVDATIRIGRRFGRAERNRMRQIEGEYRRAIAQKRALHYLATLSEEQELVVYGLKIVVPAIVVQQ